MIEEASVPCLCGWRPQMERIDGMYFRLRCPHCGACGEMAVSRTGAIAAWNQLVGAGYDGGQEVEKK